MSHPTTPQEFRQAVSGLSDDELIDGAERLLAEHGTSPDPDRAAAAHHVADLVDLELERRAELVIDGDGQQMSRRVHETSTASREFQSGLNALTGNIVSAAVFSATGNAAAAAMAGGVFDGFGAMAQGRNEFRYVPLGEAISRPDGDEPRVDDAYAAPVEIRPPAPGQPFDFEAHPLDPDGPDPDDYLITGSYDMRADLSGPSAEDEYDEDDVAPTDRDR